jgi:hypothetical protein
MARRKLTLLCGQESGDLMLDRNIAQSDVSAHPHRISYVSAPKKDAQPKEVLEELQNLLEEYAPMWYTDEHRERVQSVLQSRKRS